MIDGYIITAKTYSNTYGSEIFDAVIDNDGWLGIVKATRQHGWSNERIPAWQILEEFNNRKQGSVLMVEYYSRKTESPPKLINSAETEPFGYYQFEYEIKLIFTNKQTASFFKLKFS